MEYTVKIDAFDGPLDLLLHLIKKSNIEIFDIKIDEITKQYLHYIHTMENLNLTVASEYLVMASELIEIKSRSLLPMKQEEEEEEDPREALIERLVNYSRYKEVTSAFKELEVERKCVYTKEPSLLEEYIETDTIEEGITLDDLLTAFQKFLEKKELEKPLQTKITKKEYSVEERNIEIRNLLHSKKTITFSDLFTFYTKEYVVVTFLSVLDLTKKGYIDIEQTDNFDAIHLIEKGDIHE